jgi:signal transduction histidine kinase/CheY-like chemotaxis protein
MFFSFRVIEERIMKKKVKQKLDIEINVTAIIVALVIIVTIAVGYTVQLNKAVSNNIFQTISELAEHDQSNIQNNIKMLWRNLEYIEGKFSGYPCDTIEEMERQMNVECANSAFSHIYMVGEDGKIYTDKFLTYDPENEGQNGRIDILPYFENGDDYVVARFDDRIEMAGLTKKSILYGIRLQNFEVEGITMVALVGITDIDIIQNRLSINSFVKDGKSRGYSAVIDMDGNYIVNVENNLYTNQNDNFFDRVENGKTTDLSVQDISAKMKEGETFSFYFTNADGVKRVVYCMPFEETGVEWYFLMSVESTVFSEQNQVFLTMSMIMLVGIIVVIGFLLFFAMVSQHKVMKANAEAKARTTFLANMSHEIRTPLNGIVGLIYLLEKDVDNGETKEIIKPRLAKAKETAEYLLSLINNILDVSKLQVGKVEVKQEVISLETIVDALWSMQKNNIENRGITFNVEKEIIVPWIIGDDIVIKQVMMNILGNASKFTSEGGRITLSVTQEKVDDNHVDTIFTCADTGCGMSKEFLNHIWDSFAQERNHNENSIKGTGLGMSISKLLVDAVGGEIEVESDLGVGSTFRVVFHSEIAADVPEYLRMAEQNEKLQVLGENPGKVMVVEDNELNAEILIEILESEGYEVIHAENGQEAVEQFRDSKEGEIRVILMDMQMPIMDGCTAAEQIRAQERPDAKKVEIYACTANNFNEDRERAEASGMNGFLSKPIDVKVLLEQLSKVITILAK